MDSDAQGIVTLDALNAKQRAKEYKLTAKDIKSKEVAKRCLAIEKVNDERYFLEGGCLVPLIDSTAPKKKTLDLSKMSLQCLMAFQNKIGSDGKKLLFHGLQSILTTTESLDSLQMLCEVMSYHEEVKKKKKPKKGAEPEPEPPVDKTPDIIRYLAMQIMATFAKEVFNNEEEDTAVVKAFARIPKLLPTLCKTLFFLHPSLSADIPEEEKSQVVKGCKWLLQTLVVVLRHGEGAIEVLLSFDGIVGVMQDMWQEPSLTLPALLIVQYLSSQPGGLEYVRDSDIIQNVLAVFERACEASFSPPTDSAVSAAAVKGKPPVKGKGTPAKEDDSSMLPGTDEPDNHVGIVAVSVKFFTAIAQNAKPEVTSEDVLRVVRGLAPVLLNQEVLTQCTAPCRHRQDPDLKPFVREAAILLGSYGLISADIRAVAARDSGAVRVLLNLLQQSRAVLGVGTIDEDDAQAVAPGKGAKGGTAAVPPLDVVEVSPETMAAIYEFRHVCEKALLHLLATSPGESEATYMQTDTNHWPSCRSATIDLDALRSTVNLTSSAVEVSNASVLVDTIKHTEADISNRAVRLLSVAIHSAYGQVGVKNGVAAFEEMGLDAVIVDTLSSVLLQRVLSASVDFDNAEKAKAEARGFAVPDAHAVEGQEDVEGGEGVDEVKVGEGEMKVEPDIELSIEEEQVVEVCAVAAGVSGSANIPLLSAKDVISHVLCILKYFLDAYAAHVKAFATIDLITALAGLVYRCGPVAGPFLEERLDSDTATEEAVAILVDPRDYGWNQGEIDTSTQSDMVLIRELVFDVMSVVAEADAKYREFASDTELPQSPGNPFPESTSPCAEQSMYVYKACSNPCVATLMCRSTFKLDGTHVNAAPCAAPDTDALCKPVCEAALRLLVAIGSSGVRGLGSLYASLAQKSFEIDPDAPPCFVPAMQHLKDFFHHKVLPTQPVGRPAHGEEADEEGMALAGIDAAYSWKIPVLCELDVDNDRSPTHHLQILHRKDLWPFLTVAGALLGMLANPQTDASTMTLAVSAVHNFCRVANIEDAIQPAVADIFSGCLLGMGGVVVLGGCVGRFGPLMNCESSRAVLAYIIGHGHARESFWTEWRESRLVESEDAPKGGKGGKKDSKIPAAKKDAGKKSAAAAETEVELPFEPDDSHIDPNHGPGVETWLRLINTSCDDLHGSSIKSHPLVTCIQGGLTDISVQLIAAGAVVDQGDQFGVTPIEHALVLREKEVLNALISAGADVDCLDDAGNPAIKYAFFSLSERTWDQVFDNCRRKGLSKEPALSLLGGCCFVSDMVHTGVDLNVCDSNGNYPLHHCVGVGRLSYVIGGVSISIASDEHIDGKEISTALIQQLVNGGAPISAVNHLSVSPLHVLAALGDVSAVTTVLRLGAVPNVQDNSGFMPLHYAAAACSLKCMETMDVLMKKSILRPCFRPQFDNTRTGKSKEEKYAIDSQKILQTVLDEATCPGAIKQKRLTLADILQSYSDEGLTPSMLALCGNVLASAPHHKCLVSLPDTTSEMRVRVFFYLDQLFDGPSTSLMMRMNDSTLPASSAFSLLLAEEGYINGRESAESLFNALSSLLDICFDSFDPDAVSALPILKLNLPAQWTVLHAAIISDSDSFLKFIWDAQPTLYKFPYVHYIADNTRISENTMYDVVYRASLTRVHGSLLNAATTSYPTPPLHSGTVARNIPFLKCMLAVPQVECNVEDTRTGRTPIHVACAAEDVEIVNVFLDYRDNVDILVRDKNGENCVDTALRMKSAAVLRSLLEMKRLDVFEQLLAANADGSTRDEMSILLRLERENMALCRRMGIVESTVDIADQEVTSAVCEGNLETQGENSDLLVQDLAQLSVSAPTVNHNGLPTEGELIVNEEQTSPACSQRSDQNDMQKVVDSYANPEEELKRSEDILQEIISLLHELNMADADVHAHKCFHEGVLYRSYCQSLSERENGICIQVEEQAEGEEEHIPVQNV